MDTRESLRKIDPGWTRFDPGNQVTWQAAARKVCLTCGEIVPAGALVCVVCGQPMARGDHAVNEKVAHSSRTSGKAHASLILGCASLLLLPGLAAVIFGHWALADIKKSSGKLKGRRAAWAGLVLGYLGMVVAPALLVLSGLPLPWQAHAQPNENRAITSLRMLNIAVQAYAATYGNGFPESLAQLGPPSGQAPLDSRASGFVTGDLASGKAFGYRFTYAVTGRDASGRPEAYTIHADPPGSASSSLPHFFTDQTQVIRTSQNQLATAQSPPATSEPAHEDTAR